MHYGNPFKDRILWSNISCNQWSGYIRKTEMLAIMISFKRQILSKQGFAYLKFLLKTIIRYPSMLKNAFEMAIVGYQLQKHAEHILLSCNDLPDD